MTDAWLAVALFFSLATAASAALCAAGSLGQRFAGAQLASATAVLALVAAAAGTGSSGVYDVALTAVLASFAGTMIVSRCLERWL